MQPEFLQIGFQKCGTTYLERNIYSQNEAVNCIQAASNKELDRLLLIDLILPDGFAYDKEGFLKQFDSIKKGFFVTIT